MTQPAQRSGGADDPTMRKSTLFCWACDHSSPVDADWDRRIRGDTVGIVCPACGMTLTERPRTRPRIHRDLRLDLGLGAESASAHRSTARLVSAWRHLVVGSIRAWETMIDAGASTAVRATRASIGPTP
ncbi:hypothetical protein ACFQGT_08515 [Natrialbaceae archaeon GCM10025810]|uniref:hypothetical protein n=1 Tax=Halovalidus salilacus TaxID=3075124 RepID=UPI003609F7CB